MSTIRIRRLGPDDAGRVVDCFHRVYGASYANPDFYDAGRLAERMSSGSLRGVGALLPDGSVVGHMAMSLRRGATSAELGNTVVDPAARGEGIAWRVGAELVAWTMEIGYPGFLHYPTTVHPIIQRQSVESGFETGLMLGYIPAATDGKTTPKVPAQRQASTIVYQPLGESGHATQFLPDYCADRIRGWAESARVPRTWARAGSPLESTPTTARSALDEHRGLSRLTVARVGPDVSRAIRNHDRTPADCRQIDFSMADVGIQSGVSAALEAGYWFCGWLPGFSDSDVFRLQWVDRALTEMEPGVSNEVARSLLGLIP